MRTVACRAWLATALTVVLSLGTACSVKKPATSPIEPPVGPQLSTALRHWVAFPAEATSRPLVVAGNVISPGHFTDPADEVAFIGGAIDVPRTLPAGPARAVGFPLISAARAADELTAPAPPGGAGTTTRLAVTSVRLGTAVFTTDRGRRNLPAWQFSFHGASHPADVLAVAPPRMFWPVGVRHRAASQTDTATELGGAGRTLRLTFTGGEPGTGPCQTSWSVRQRSSDRAVAVYLVGFTHAIPQACPAMMRRIQLTVTLPAPLGNRVLIDALTFAPIPVIRSW